MKTKLAYLVYQSGIANVFAVAKHTMNPAGRKAIRLLQSGFRDCLYFARGLKQAGVDVKIAACNQAGDITESVWTDDLDRQPFSESFAYTI